MYLGGYEHAEHAAEAYDVAAIKCRGFKVKTNFDVDRQAAWIPTAEFKHASSRVHRKQQATVNPA